jgi:hypothetical protein
MEIFQKKKDRTWHCLGLLYYVLKVITGMFLGILNYIFISTILSDHIRIIYSIKVFDLVHPHSPKLKYIKGSIILRN